MASLTGVASGDVRFTPESGHKWLGRGMSAFDPKRTLRRAALDVSVQATARTTAWPSERKAPQTWPRRKAGLSFAGDIKGAARGRGVRPK